MTLPEPDAEPPTVVHDPFSHSQAFSGLVFPAEVLSCQSSDFPSWRKTHRQPERKKRCDYKKNLIIAWLKSSYKIDHIPC